MISVCGAGHEGVVMVSCFDSDAQQIFVKFMFKFKFKLFFIEHNTWAYIEIQEFENHMVL